MNRCTMCPELTINKTNWCYECKAQADFEKCMAKIEANKKSLKQLMRDPNWEDHANLYDGY